MVIKRVGPLSCAKIVGVLYAILGLVFGAIFSLISLAGAFISSSSQSAGFGALLGAGAIVFFPFLYGAIGFISTLIGAALYNLLAGMVGGIELEVQ